MQQSPDCKVSLENTYMPCCAPGLLFGGTKSVLPMCLNGNAAVDGMGS